MHWYIPLAACQPRYQVPIPDPNGSSNETEGGTTILRVTFIDEIRHKPYALRAWESFLTVVGVENICWENLRGCTPIHYECDSNVHARAVSYPQPALLWNEVVVGLAWKFTLLAWPPWCGPQLPNLPSGISKTATSIQHEGKNRC